MQANVEAKFAKLIRGDVTYSSPNLAVNLLITRLQKTYQANPSQEEEKKCIEEVDKFYNKYAKILDNELAAIMKL